MSSEMKNPEDINESAGQTTEPQQEDSPEEESKGPAEKEKKPFQFPSTFAILFGLAILIAIMTWIIPAGLYKLDKNGSPEPGTYHQVTSHPQGVGDVLMSPINGMYGLESNPGPLLPEDNPNEVNVGTISVNNEGALYGSIGVGLFVLVIGAFITMTMRSGAIAAGIGSVTRGLKGREVFLIPTLMVIFAVGGSTFGMGEETLGFYPIIIALMLGLGYDTMTAIATIARSRPGRDRLNRQPLCDRHRFRFCWYIHWRGHCAAPGHVCGPGRDRDLLRDALCTACQGGSVALGCCRPA